MELRRLEERADDVQESAVMDPEIRAYYETGVERDRLMEGYSRIEYERTKELLERHLPPAPARVLDVGGGPGAYAKRLADAGYDVRLVDASPLHVRQALERAGGRFTAVEGDARSLDEADASHDAVLLLGPLYHLTERDDRLRALLEARRVLRLEGVVAAAAISRFASVLDGLYADESYFTTAFFHRPEEFAAEVEEAGFVVEAVFGVEGPGWLLADRWDDAVARQNILRAARVLETEPTVLGTSAHLLAIARAR
ncbi:MAG: class I SAM-dependent methyltransferase [Actinobacteria bacterium]|nr:MAG: class I SAM-dependent methyltransferase [Actinomycetota bacterium]